MEKKVWYQDIKNGKEHVKYEENGLYYEVYYTKPYLNYAEDGTVSWQRDKVTSVQKIKYHEGSRTFGGSSLIGNPEVTRKPLFDSHVEASAQNIAIFVLKGLEKGYKESGVKAATDLGKILGDPKQRAQLYKQVLAMDKTQVMGFLKEMAGGAIDDFADLFDKSTGAVKSSIAGDYVSAAYKASYAAGKVGTDALAGGGLSKVAGLSASGVAKFSHAQSITPWMSVRPLFPEKKAIDMFLTNPLKSGGTLSKIQKKNVYDIMHDIQAAYLKKDFDAWNRLRSNRRLHTLQKHDLKGWRSVDINGQDDPMRFLYKLNKDGSFDYKIMDTHNIKKYYK